ncbi:MAG: hypothetical protein A2Z40_05720 [Deltaproteobacteria bacterium RBG_19FT_COMBO_60_16]|nr:MAG: hypothetical protein A2Z40_05720 [Deltaproteobacteria bacterium RBG_19FT_COMBO_60_16]
MTDEDRNEVAEAIWGLTRAIDRLGNGNASTDLGAIEAMSMKIGEAIERGLSEIADAIRSRAN